MFSFTRLRNALIFLFRRRQWETDLENEFRDHWNQEVECNLRSGMSLDEAEHAARRLIGPPSLYKEACRDAWGARFLESLHRDVHYGLRSIRKNSAFSLIAILALSLGIGASTAIYTLVRTVVFNPLPFPNAGRLVQIQTVSGKTGKAAMWALYADISDWKARSHTFESIGSYGFALLNVPGDPPAGLYGVRVTYDLFPTLGVHPVLGRNFSPQEDRPGSGQEIILSNNLWRTRFGSDPHILGRTIRLVGQRETDAYVVVGIMPSGFNFPLTIPNSVNPPTRQMAYWIPVAKEPSRTALTYLSPIGLLRPGVSLRRAQSDLSSIAAQLQQEYPDTNTGRTIHLIPLKDEILGQSKVALILLLAAIATILAIICANLTNLFLSRAFSRTRESGVRLALGASRSRLLQQWLVESLLLASLSGVAAVLIAKTVLQILLRFAPEGIPRISEARLDPPALLFLALAALFAGSILGLLPALTAARTDLQIALSSAGSRTTGQQGQIRIRDLLIVAEVSLTVVLALGAGLLIKSFSRLTSLDPGFSRDHVAMAVILLVDRKYPDLRSRANFARQLLDELKQNSGILSAGMTDATPLSGNTAELPVRIDNRSSSERGSNRPIAEVFSVSVDYLAAAGINLRRGRYLTKNDAHHAVALINQAAAEAFWRHQDPLGKRVGFENGATPSQGFSIIGIVSDTRDDDIDQPARAAIYLPMEQGVAPPQMLVAKVRSDVSNTSAAQMIHHAVTALDKNQPVFLVTSMNDLYNNSIAERRFTTFLLTSLSTLALVLAALGIYGIIAYSATQRTREIGIRAALGAQNIQIAWLVLSRSFLLSLAGTTFGLTIGLLLTHYLSALLYEVSTNDLPTITTVVILITGTSLLAGWIPSSRAVRIGPMEALRQE